MDIRLGRKPMGYDARDFRMSDFLSLNQKYLALAPAKRLWHLRTILDQGETPHCVGFAWAQYGICEPVSDLFTNSDGDKIYNEAKVIDGEPNQENGSTTRSGAKAMRQRGRISNYAFASSLDDIVSWLLSKGPVVTGTNWTVDMSHPDSKGFVKPTGAIVGGHEYLVVGVDTTTRIFTFANSWGNDFGKKGFFYMTYNDYQELLYSGGDACVALELPLPQSPTVVSDWFVLKSTESEIILHKNETF